MTLAVAAKVIASHAGRPDIVAKDKWLLRSVAILTFLAALSRLGVDWAPASRDRHLLYAVLCVLLALGLWSTRYLPLLFKRQQPAVGK